MKIRRGWPALIGVVVLFAAAQTDAAPLFPNAALGDPFSGTFTVDPATPDALPPSCGFCYGGLGPAIGSATAQLEGKLFSANVDAIFVSPGTDSLSRWFLNSFLNDPAITGTISIALYGSAASTTILPLAFASYTFGTFEIVAQKADLTSGAVYFGILNSLIQLDATANFTFSGIITEGNLWSLDETGHAVAVPFSATPLPAALPLFITGLGTLGLLGWRRKRNESLRPNAVLCFAGCLK